MVTKVEALYNALLPLRVVNFNDIIEKASSIIKAAPNRRYIYRKYVKRLIEKGKLQRIRKRLYLVLSPIEDPEKHVVDKLLIASKIRAEYYLGFHTARGLPFPKLLFILFWLWRWRLHLMMSILAFKRGTAPKNNR